MATLSHTPWWVFLLFAYVLFVGIKGLSTRSTPVWRLAIIPVLFAVWGVYGLGRVLGAEWEGWLVFVLSLLVGLALGWQLAKLGQAQRLPDGPIQLQGSPITLILILLIFCSKYALGYWQAVNPGAGQSMTFLLVDAGVVGVVIGMFVGRFAGILRRCQLI